MSAVIERERHHAGIVDEHVDAAELGLGEVDERLHVGAARHVDSAEACRAALGLDVGDELFEALRTPRADHDLGAALGEQAGRGLADAAAAPGDGDDFSFDVAHDLSPFRTVAIAAPE